MRVFNVSDSRCGTRSMDAALRILGFNSHHWVDVMDLWRPWVEGRLHEVEALREENSAWGDSPIQLLYRGLHMLYPEEKYIFVNRDSESWLRSMKSLLWAWGSGTHPVHTLRFGYALHNDNKDDRALLRSHERLTQDILDYFKGKPNFLEIDFASLGWEPLCSFLGKDIPEAPFPHLNASA